MEVDVPEGLISGECLGAVLQGTGGARPHNVLGLGQKF